jgi:acyl-coenzyme A thioesterase PaaI-like protein
MTTSTMRVTKHEHLEDFTQHEWCNTLLSDPTITSIAKRHIPDQREGVSNTFFTRTLFTDNAMRAFLSLYRPGKGEVRKSEEDEIFTGSLEVNSGKPSAIHETLLRPSNVQREAERQARKEEVIWDINDPDAPEALILASLGNDVDGGIRRLHGGVTATLLDQVMGTLLSYHFEYTSATSELNVKYLKAINTPCVVLCRAKMTREKGRWIETWGVIEDGKGTVFAEGKGAFVLGKVAAGKM